LKELESKHALEIAALSGSSEGNTPETSQVKFSVPEAAAEPAPAKSAQEEERERKQEKARRKREKAREKERERELQIEKENAEAGPSARQIELEQIQQQLAPLGLEIAEIPSDGNCLYRAISAHVGNSFQDARK